MNENENPSTPETAAPDQPPEVNAPAPSVGEQIASLIDAVSALNATMQQVVINTQKPAREPLPPKMPSGESVGKKSIYNL